MSPYQAILGRHSVREYSDQPVDRKIIERMLEAARHAPCSCNLQLMRYVVVDDPQLGEQLAPLVSKKLLWAPTNIFFFIDPRMNQQRWASIMGLGAAMQNMALVAHQEGLATCPMAGFSGDDALKEKLGVPDYFAAVLILGVGHPKDNHQARARQRLPLQESFDFNRFDSNKNLINDSVHLSDWSVQQLIDYRKRIAPVYRYQQRFSLQSFNKKIYTHLFQRLKNIFGKTQSVLDLHTYDGFFVKLMLNDEFATSYNISDFLPYTLESLQDFSKVLVTHPIALDGSIPSIIDNSQELVTCVHKVNFIPDLEKTFFEAARVLRPGGHFFVSSAADKATNRDAVPKGQENVYDGNPFYKIGPHSHRSLALLDQFAAKTELQKHCSEIKDLEYLPGESHKYYLAVYKK